MSEILRSKSNKYGHLLLIIDYLFFLTVSTSSENESCKWRLWPHPSFLLSLGNT